MLFDFILPGSKTNPHPDIGLLPGLVKTNPKQTQKQEQENQRLEELYAHTIAMEEEWATILNEATTSYSPQPPEEILDLLEELEEIIPSQNDTALPINESTTPLKEPELHAEIKSTDIPPPIPKTHPLEEMIRTHIHRTDIAKPNFASSLFPEYPYQKMFIDIVYHLLEENQDKEINVDYVTELFKLFSRGKEYQQAGLIIGQGLIARDHPIAANRILETILLCENQDNNLHQNTKINLITNSHLEPTYAENLLNSIINEDPAFTTEFNDDIFEPCLLHYLTKNSNSSAANFLLGQYYLKQAQQTNDPNFSEKAATHLLTSIESTTSLLDTIRYSIEENNYLSVITEHAKELQSNQTNITQIPIYSLLTKVFGRTEFLITYLHHQAEKTEESKDWYILAYNLINDLVTGDKYELTNLEFTKWSFYKALENNDPTLTTLATKVADNLLEKGHYNLAALVFYELTKADPTNDYATNNLAKAKKLSQD